MADTSTSRQLLIVAIQDLQDGARVRTEALERLHDKAGTGLQGLFDADRCRSVELSARLEDMLESLGDESKGDPNIWMRGIADDATRDSETVAAGPLRDIAMAGALRKGAQSARVSFETAMLLAQSLNLSDQTADLARYRDDEAEADERLRQLYKTIISHQSAWSRPLLNVQSDMPSLNAQAGPL